MREDTNKDFDLLVREAMADAEVRVPSRVWKGVSARIGAAATTSGAWTSLWRWAAPSLAVAAVAAFFIISGTTEKTIINEGRQALDVKTATSSFEPSLCAADVPSLMSAFVPRETPQLESAEKPIENYIAATVEAEDEVVSLQAQITEQPGTTSDKAAVSNGKEESFDDPFAAMEAEDARIEASRKSSAGRTSLLLGGTLGANDTHYNSNTFGPSFASGSKVQGAVDEKSISDFGFPVSLGLGVKYHVADKIAIGTGVNWTMLSRTFDGSYKTEDGLVTHKMQYVGIPVHVYYDLVSKRTLQIYAYTGGSAEKAVSNKYFMYEKSSSPIYQESVNGLQYGIDLGFGVEFKVNNVLSVYLDPYAKYWFAGTQPKSIRTEKPLIFSFEGGLRFTL